MYTEKGDNTYSMINYSSRKLVGLKEISPQSWKFVEVEELTAFFELRTLEWESTHY